MADQGRGYVLTDDDINAIAEHVAAGDPRSMHIPNGSVATLIGMLRGAQIEKERLRTQMARLDDCLTATVEAKGSSRYAGQGRLITLLTVDDVREMISEWREAGGGDA